MEYLRKAIEKSGLTRETALNIIATEHELNVLAAGKKMSSMELDLSKECLKFVKKVSKALKVSQDAVVCSILAAEAKRIVEDNIIRKAFIDRMQEKEDAKASKK